ncbi:MAG: hypothetical protein WC548_01100 [Candidatus Pacearchaeota archaeon]
MIPGKVVFIDDELEKAFESLKDSDPVKKGLKKAIREISENAFCGRNVKKSLIPAAYSYFENLWIYNLPSAWRLIYSLAPSKVEIIAVVLDWMDHKDYERLFNF